jgi:hypothetical protein
MLFFLLFFAFFCLCAVISSEERFKFPIISTEMSTEGSVDSSVNAEEVPSISSRTSTMEPLAVEIDGKKRVQFVLETSQNIQDQVAAFCEQYSLDDVSCKTLYYTSGKHFTEMLQNEVTSDSIDAPEAESLNSEKRDFYINNKHSRIREAYVNEMELEFNLKSFSGLQPYNFTDVFGIERIQKWRHVAILHSCSLMKQKFNVLLEMLQNMHQLPKSRDAFDVIFIFNYGQPLSLSTKAFISRMNSLSADGSQNTPDLWVQAQQCSSSCQDFEIPTIRLMQRLSRLMRPTSRLLYMHTKGVSYADIPLEIHDHRRMMMYFLVKLHSTVNSLFSCGRLDALGATFSTRGVRLSDGASLPSFPGNFFWTRAGYLTRLRLVNDSAGKYWTETFLLGDEQLLGPGPSQPRYVVMWPQLSYDFAYYGSRIPDSLYVAPQPLTPKVAVWCNARETYPTLLWDTTDCSWTQIECP